MSTHYYDYDKHYEYGYLEPERGETIRFDEVAVAAVEGAWREAFPPPCDHKWVPIVFEAQGVRNTKDYVPLYRAVKVYCMVCGEERDIEREVGAR